MSMDAAKLWNQPVATDYQSQPVQTLSFNRLSTSHSKFVPKVHGFRLNDINENDNTVINSVNGVNVLLTDTEPQSLPMEQPMQVQHVLPVQVHVEPPKVPSKPTFVRSTSAGDMSKKFRFTTYENRNQEVVSPEVHFGQNTLRRTGLKEKILLPDEQKNVENGFGRVLEQPKVSTYQTSLSSVVGRSMESKPIPPPPPPKILKGVKKSFSVPEQTPDSRDQLMDGIRNFRFNSLKTNK